MYSRRANNEWVDHGKVDHPRERLLDTKNLATKRFSYHKTIKITIRATFLHISNPERDSRAHYRNTSHSLFPISRKLSSKDFSNLEGTRNVRFMHIHELRASIVSIPFRVRTSLKVRIDESFRRLERKTKGWNV